MSVNAEDLISELRDLLDAQQLPPLMTTKQVADLLDLSTEWLFNARKARTGPPFIQISRQTVRYDRDDVLAWARSHRVETVM
tara:strand:- start:498 stop:743 length:246 start_codon:yes stop_codon:yes gene_type:complete